jgi:hypothetical protein
LPQDTLFPRTFRRIDGRQWAARHNVSDPQKVGQLQDAARAVFEGSERHVASGEVSDVMEVLPYENCPGDRDRGGAHSHGTGMNMKRMNAAHNHIGNPPHPKILGAGAALLFRALPATLTGSAAPRIDGRQMEKEIAIAFECKPVDSLQAILTNRCTLG